MINEHMMDLGSRRSTIRELFEYGNSRAAIVGRENVFDFSIGNPNVPAPEAVRQAIYAEAAGDPVALHGYTSAQGAADVRGALADSLNDTQDTDGIDVGGIFRRVEAYLYVALSSQVVNLGRFHLVHHLDDTHRVAEIGIVKMEVGLAFQVGDTLTIVD